MSILSRSRSACRHTISWIVSFDLSGRHRVDAKKGASIFAVPTTDEVIEASAAATTAYFGGLAGAPVVRQRADVDRPSAGAEKIRNEGANRHEESGRKRSPGVPLGNSSTYMSISSFKSSAIESGLPSASVQPTMCITGKKIFP